jgi:NAD(P)-dependent dehydrogenase (short-subunit alcohol dehydrogenase family)
MTAGAVLVTGASTGIGEATVRALAGRANRVYAGVRKAEDADRLRADRITPVILDVTDQDQIDAAVRLITEEVGDRGLGGVVNNAGVALGGPLEYLPLDEWRTQLEVNVIGQVAVTRAVLPLIRAGRGRIVFIGSIGGRVGTPLMGPYAASKFAVEGLAESLRHELAPWGIAVSVIEPGAIKTAIWDKGRATADRLEQELPEEARERYAGAMQEARDGIEQNDRRGIGPEKVAEAVEHALFHPRPRHRYLVGTDAKGAAFLSRFLPDRAKHRFVGRFG